MGWISGWQEWRRREVGLGLGCVSWLSNSRLTGLSLGGKVTSQNDTRSWASDDTTGAHFVH